MKMVLHQNYKPSQKNDFASKKDMGPKGFFEMACSHLQEG
jgi:hypothetical protein